MQEENLHENLNALHRVRTRLFAAPDSSLPKILTGLTPRLLQRLNLNQVQTAKIFTSSGNESSGSARQSLLVQTKDQLTTILSHIVVRLRGGRHTIPRGAPWVLPLLSLLENKDFQSALAITFSLLILQHSSPFLLPDSAEAVTEVGCAKQKEHVVSILRALCRFVDKLHWTIASNSPDATSEATLLHFRTSTWIVYDIVSIFRGIPALIDVDQDDFDECSFTLIPARLSLLDGQAIVGKEFLLGTTGAFQQWLDLLLFWPSDTQKSRPRRRLVHTEAEILIETSTGLSEEGHRRVNHRFRDGRRSWNTRYLRELKLASMESIIVAPLRNALDSGNNIIATTGDVQILRSLILCVLSSSPDSMHGKVALQQVDRLRRGDGDEVKETQAKRMCQHRPKLFSNEWLDLVDRYLLLVCSLLALLLGDALATSVLNFYPEQKEKIEAVVGKLRGPRHTANTSNGISAERDMDGSLLRAPMPFGVTSNVVDFIHSTLLVPAFRSEAWSRSPLVATTGLRVPGFISVFIDLVTSFSTSRGRIGSIWAIQLLDGIYSNMLSESKCHAVDTKSAWGFVQRQYYNACLEVSSVVLSHIAEAEADTVTILGEIQQNTEQAALPGGVPQPFPGRRDLNMMLASHRSSQKKRQLRAGFVLEARKTAYRMITDLSSLLVESNKGDLRLPQKQESFRETIPKLLLKCASEEENSFMHQFVLLALDSVLDAILSRFGISDEPGIRKQAMSLLPSILCAVCSESSIARFAALRWVSTFVRPFDPGAAFHVCSFLVNDIDDRTSEAAKSALESFSPGPPTDMKVSSQCVQQFNFDDENDRQIVATSFELDCVDAVSILDMPVDICRALLCANKFGMKPLCEALEEDRDGALGNAGVLERFRRLNVENGAGENYTSEPFLCSICYDEFEPEEGFSLSCLHVFCSSCWNSYLDCKMEERARTSTAPVSIDCPSEGCVENVLYEDIKAIAPELLPRFHEALLRSFVASSRAFGSCPGPDCSFVAQILSDGQSSKVPNLYPSIQCANCATNYCFECSSFDHQPARCDDFFDWNKIFGSSQHWVKKNTKPCPSCSVPIEKYSGCSHMHCSQCNHDFCWLCLTTLRSHMEPHICNRYEPHTAASDDDERRSLFFTDRFKVHDDAETFTRKEARLFSERREKLGNEILWFTSDEDMDSMATGLETLIHARRFLKYSYIAAWAMRHEESSIDVFESYQGNLELFTEKLSQLLLANVHNLYLENGPRGVHLHFRAMSFSTESVQKYMERIMAFVTVNL